MVFRIFGEENFFQFRLGHVGHARLVEFSDRQAKLRAELGQRQRRQAAEFQHVVRGLHHWQQIINERARPIENDIANDHPARVAQTHGQFGQEKADIQGNCGCAT